MRAALVKLSYKQIIDGSMTGAFEQDIINASYYEFRSKSQLYNPERKHTTFRQMLQNDGRANSLHYKCGVPAAPFVELLDNNIPGLYDNTGKSIKFSSYQFHIVDSDINDVRNHKVKITYITDTITALDHVEDYMLLAYGNKADEMAGLSDKEIDEAFLLKIVPRLSIYSYMSIRALPLVSAM